MSLIRRFTLAALPLTAVGLMVSVVTSASAVTTTPTQPVGHITASAARTGQSIPLRAPGAVTPADSENIHDGALGEVAATYINENGGPFVTAIGSSTRVSFFGHMQFYGPRGSWGLPNGGNTPSEYIAAGSFRELPEELPYDSPPGSLWCVQFWEDSNGGHTPLGKPNCVEF